MALSRTTLWAIVTVQAICVLVLTVQVLKVTHTPAQAGIRPSSLDFQGLVAADGPLLDMPPGTEDWFPLPDVCMDMVEEERGSSNPGSTRRDIDTNNKPDTTTTGGSLQPLQQRQRSLRSLTSTIEGENEVLREDDPIARNRCDELRRVRVAVAREYAHVYTTQMAGPPETRRYLTVKCGCGIGNKIRCISSSILFAILDRRVLVVDAPFLHDVFEDAFGGSVRWKASQFVDELKGVGQNDRIEVSMKKLYDTPTLARRHVVYADCDFMTHKIGYQVATWVTNLNFLFPPPSGLDAVYSLGNLFFGSITDEARHLVEAQKDALQWDHYKLHITVHLRRCVDCKWGSNQQAWSGDVRFAHQRECMKDFILVMKRQAGAGTDETIILYTTDQPSDFALVESELKGLGHVRRTIHMDPRKYFKNGLIHSPGDGGAAPSATSTPAVKAPEGFFNSEHGAKSPREEQMLFDVIVDFLMVAEGDEVITTGTTFPRHSVSRAMKTYHRVQWRADETCAKIDEHSFRKVYKVTHALDPQKMVADELKRHAERERARLARDKAAEPKSTT